ncbi:putative Hydrolethalus syndrome protein 1 C-terminus-like, partial [Homarus americanus]
SLILCTIQYGIQSLVTIPFRSVDSSTSQTEKNGDKETEESGYSDFDSTASTTTESHKEKSDFTSAWHSLADSAAEVELPNGKTMKSVTDSHKAPTKSGTDLHITSKRPIGDAPKEPSGSQVKQNLGRRKVSKMARDKDGLPIYPSRPDPVNLYHFYKAHWDKFKVPGEDPRSKLRWATMACERNWSLNQDEIYSEDEHSIDREACIDCDIVGDDNDSDPYYVFEQEESNDDDDE